MKPGDEVLELEAPDKGGTDDETTPEAFKEAPGATLDTKIQRIPVVLMSLMVLGAIDGSTNSKADPLNP
jgi:hypothetical protein